MNEITRAYYSGFFDGEGTVFFYDYKDRHGKIRKRLVAKITQVDRTPLDQLREIMECGNVYSKSDKRGREKGWQDAHEIVFSDRSARQFLCYVEPYLIVKKDKVTGILDQVGRKY